MKLYYSPTSPYVRKVLMTAMERGLDDRIERITVNGFGEEHRGANPLGKVPALVPDGGGPALFDSLVICDHLDGLAGPDGRLIPAEDPARSRTLRAHALGQGITDAALLLQQQKLRNQKLDAPLPEDWWIERQRTAVRAACDDLERDLAPLEGPLDLGQISVATALGYLDFRFPDLAWREGRPKLAAWCEAFARRPSFAQTAPPEG